MITLEYFDGEKWIQAGEFYTEHAAWISLGSDNENYRTVDENGRVIRENLMDDSNQ